MPSIIGVEVAKTSIVCCAVDSENIPRDLACFARSYSPLTLLSDISGVQALLELGDRYVIEPTGDYSKIWIDTLKANGKTVLRVNPKRVRALKDYSGIASKTDRYDAAFLALYGAMNHHDPNAFLSDYAEDLRQAVLNHQFISRMTGNHQRRLWQLLSREWPEVCRSRNGTKPQQNRPWLDANPSALWRFIAGEDIAPRWQREREASLNESIGNGLSPLSRALAAQVCELERRQYPIEQQISAFLEAKQFAPYHAVFDEFGFGDMTRAAILSRVYPFENFLGPDGKAIKIKAPSSKTEGRYHRRDKSLGAFRLALGNGTRAYQSGQTNEQRAAGSKVARNALFLHVKTKVVIWGSRSNMALPRYLKQHSELYQSMPKMPHNQAVMKVVSRLVKDLYRELLAGL